MKKKKIKKAIKIKMRYWLVPTLCLLVFLGGFFSYWDLLIPSYRAKTSDPEAVIYRIDKDHFFLFWSGKIYVVNLPQKTIVIPSRYGHYFWGVWIWPKGLDNYKGVMVGDLVKSTYGKFAFDGHQVYLEHPLDHSLILQLM